MKRDLLTACLTGMFSIFSVYGTQAQTPPTYSIYSLGANTTGLSISQDGTFVTGLYYNTNGGFSNPQPGFLWTQSGGVVTLPAAGSTNHIDASPNAVNNSGMVAGAVSTTFYGADALPVLYSNTSSATVLPLPAASTVGKPYGINNAGTVAGTIQSDGNWYAATFTPTSATVLTQTPTNGAILQYAFGGSPTRGGLVVTSLADSGPGSLRRAINQANAAGRYRQITFAIDNVVNAGGTIRLTVLPVIRVPVSIDGRAAAENPFAPRFAADARVAINFNGRAGFQFARSATGSQVIGLALGGSREFAITGSTGNLEIIGNRFGTDLAGASLPNRRGSFGGDARKAVVTPPESPLMTNGRQSDVHRPLVFSGATFVSGVRTDTVGGTIEVGLDPDGPEGPLSAQYFTVDPASPGALTSAAIESALAGATSAWRSSLGKQQGGSFVIDVTAGTQFPVARIPGAPADSSRDLTLTWLSQVGNTVSAEFSLAPKAVLPSDGNKALTPYLGKTWNVSFMVPATGVSTSGQRSEMAATIGRLGTSNVAVGFYAVSNANSGSIGGLAATDPGYAAAALAAARSAGLFFEGSRLPTAGRMRDVSLPGWDPGQAYGIVITVGGDPATAVTTYQKPPVGAEYQPRFRAFALAGGRTAIGVEASEQVTSRDFADLVVTLPSNARLKSSV